jgi:hypothetical protein
LEEQSETIQRSAESVAAEEMVVDAQRKREEELASELEV